MADENARTAVLGVGIAAIASNAFASGGYGFWDAIVGILLFFVLVEFWNHGFTAKSLERAYAFAFAYVLLMILGPIGDIRFPFLHSPDGLPSSFWEVIFADATKTFDWRGLGIFTIWILTGFFILIARRAKQ